MNPALLDALTSDLIDHQFDLQHLMRTIVNSRAYQASFVTNEWNATDAYNFSHAMPRRLPAEVLMDAVAEASGARVTFPETPEDTSASQLPDPHAGKDGFLDLFGRPARESACECERRADLSLPQALNLINGKTISDAIADPKGKVDDQHSGGQRQRGNRCRISISQHCRARPQRPNWTTQPNISPVERARERRRICFGRCSTARVFFTATKPVSIEGAEAIC